MEHTGARKERWHMSDWLSLLICVIAVFVMSAAFCFIASAQDDNPYVHSYRDPEPKPDIRYVGVQLDVGVPSGAALGISVHPGTDVFRLGVAGTFNGLAPGLRGSLTFDPVDFGVAPTLTLQYGGSFAGKLPNSSAKISYTYFDLLPGIEFGSRGAFRFFVRGGITWMDVNIRGFDTLITKGSMMGDNIDVRVGNPKIQAHLIPALQLGFNAFFF